MQGMGIPKTPEEMRALLDGFAPMLNAGAPEVGAVHEKVSVAGAHSDVTADVIVPEGEGPWPVLVYLHGGGWICGSPATHAKLARRFAEAGYLVFNVDYRLAPEHPFPAPFEDCVDAIRWAAAVAAQYGGDPARLAIGGDSAGGNLSAAAAIALSDDPSVDIRAALLIYGVFDFAKIDAGIDSPALQQQPDLAAAGGDLIELMAGSYLGADRGQELLEDPRVSPLHGAAKLPPVHVLCGTGDPLLAQAQALVEKLREAGVEHEHVEIPDMPHGFAQMEFFPQARQTIDEMAAFLRKHLG
jgi:acetyl esterase